jgi:DNA repair protein RAD16
MNAENRCNGCGHSGMHHVSVFNQELLNPITKFGNTGPGKIAFEKLRLLTDHFMLRRVKRDHSSAMELPAKELRVDRQFFGEIENDFATSIMNNTTRKFQTYVAQGVMLNNYGKTIPEQFWPNTLTEELSKHIWTTYANATGCGSSGSYFKKKCRWWS